jgi:hypothetical protein
MEAGNVLELKARRLQPSNEQNESSRVLREVVKDHQVEVEELCFSDNKVLWKKGFSPDTRLVKNVFSSEFPIEQAFWCQFDGESSEVKLDCVCIVDCENLTLYSDTGTVFHVSVPFKVKKVWPISGGLLIERQVNPLLDVDNLSTVSGTEDGLPVLFTLTHPLDDICPVTSQQGKDSVNYLYDPQLTVLATFTDPSLVVTYDAGRHCHAVWTMRDTELGDIPVQLPAMCRNLSSIIPQKTPQVMSSSAPEKYPAHFPGRGTPIMTPIQRLLFKTPGIFSPGRQSTLGVDVQGTPFGVQGSGNVGQTSSRDPIAEQLDSGGRVSQRLKTAVRIGSGRTPMKMRLSGRIAQDIERELLCDRKTKSYSPLRSSPLRFHYSRSWSTVFCDPVVSDETILDSMGDPLLPEKCMELLWHEDHSTCVATDPACDVFKTCDVNGRRFVVCVLKSAGIVRLLEYAVQDGSNLVSTVSLGGEISGVMAVPIKVLDMMVVKQGSGKLYLYSGSTVVGQLHVCDDCGGRVDGIVKMTNDCGHRLTFVLSSGEVFCCELPPLASSSLVRLCLRSLQSVFPVKVSEEIVHSFYMWQSQSVQWRSGGEWAVFSKWILTALQITPQFVSMPDPLLSRGIAQVPLLKMFASPITLRGASKPAQPTDPPGIPLSVPTLLPIAGDVLGALHLVYEELKLNTAHNEDVKMLRSLLYSVSKCFGWTAYMDIYFRDWPEVYLESGVLQCDHRAAKPPPGVVSFTAWLKSLVEGVKVLVCVVLHVGRPHNLDLSCKPIKLNDSAEVFQKSLQAFTLLFMTVKCTVCDSDICIWEGEAFLRQLPPPAPPLPLPGCMRVHVRIHQEVYLCTYGMHCM